MSGKEVDANGEEVHDVEELLSKLTTVNVSKSAPVTRNRVEVEDCLNAAEKTSQSHPIYKRRVITEHVNGFTFGSATKEMGNMYVSKCLVSSNSLGRSSPGPLYSAPSFTDHLSCAQSFPKASRMPSHSKKGEQTPGPHYDIPGSVGKQLIKPSAPVTKISNSARFLDAEFISAAHCKSASSKDSPAPSAYAPELPSNAPSFSFASGGRDLPPGKIFISSMHSKHDGCGSDSPGPMYTHSLDVTREGKNLFAHEPKSTLHQFQPDIPKERFASQLYISRDHSNAEPGRMSPGPSCYSHTVKTGSDKPAFSFGVLDSSGGKRFISRELIATRGMESPGPQYKPNDSGVRKAVCSTVFADRDPLLSSLLPRFPTKEATPGSQSPGPAAYAPIAHSGAPAYTMARREKILMKRICPAPERARYVSKEMAKENYGAYSPGPKYKIPDTIGSAGSFKCSFGMSDRSFPDLAPEARDKIGTIEKPYGAPVEARFISQAHAKCTMLGKYSPGPKYNPNCDSVEKHVPAHSMAGRWKEEKFEKATKAELLEDKKKLRSKAPMKDQGLQFKSAPIIKFGTSKRGLGVGEDSKTRLFPGKDSPGPVYRPNFAAVDSKKPSFSIGGLH